MSANQRTNGVKLTKKDIARFTDEISKRPVNLIRRASEGSLTDTIALALCTSSVPAKHRRDVFSLFLKFLRDAESTYKKLGAPKQPSYAAVVIRVLGGIANSFSFVKEDKAIAQELEKDWKVIVRWVRLFCDNFKSAQDPFPGASIQYEDWYFFLAKTLFLANADEELTFQLWSVSDARYALYQLWLLDGPALSVRVVPVCARVLGAIIRHQYEDGADPAAELVKQSGVGEEGLAHLAMTRLIKVTKSGDAEDMRDNAYVVLALISSRDYTLRSFLLKKKAIPYLTETFVKLARVEAIRDSTNSNFVESLLLLFENITEPTGAVPWIIQALRHGFLGGVVNCGAFLDSLHQKAVDSLKHIIEKVMIKYLAYYSFLIGVLSAMRDIDHEQIKRCIDQSPLMPQCMRFEQYLLERTAYKALYEQTTVSDFSTSRCAQCRKEDVKNNFQKCASCQTVHYCSKDCQRMHWKSGGHRAMCKDVPEEARGLDKRNQKFSGLITMCDVKRHVEGLNQMAVKKYGLEPVPRGRSVPPGYGYSADYSTVPPTLDVFELEEERGKDFCLSYKEEYERLNKLAEAHGNDGCLVKAVVPRGASSMTQLVHGAHIREKDYGNFDEVMPGQPPRRPPGIDRDGAPLRVTEDAMDTILDGLSAAGARVGEHFRWDSCSRRDDGQVNVVDETNRRFNLFLNKFGKKFTKTYAGHTGYTEGSKK